MKILKQLDINRLLISIPVLLSFISSIFVYPYLPEKIPSHWNFQGEVNGYLGKFWGVFLVPFIMLFMYIIFMHINKIDPLKVNIEKFKKHYDRFLLILMIFLLVIHSQVILWSLGIQFSPNIILPLALSPLFYYIGDMLPNTERNWTIGIRTPWTMSSDTVWKKTHDLGGTLFKIMSFCFVIGSFFGIYAFYFVMIPIISLSIYLIVFSYLEFKKEENKNHAKDSATR